MRNFYLIATVDGRKTQLTGGPMNRAGGMQVDLFVRDNGMSKKAYTLYCFVPIPDPGNKNPKEVLVVDVIDSQGTLIDTLVTERG